MLSLVNRRRRRSGRTSPARPPLVVHCHHDGTPPLFEHPTPTNTGGLTSPRLQTSARLCLGKDPIRQKRPAIAGRGWGRAKGRQNKQWEADRRCDHSTGHGGGRIRLPPTNRITSRPLSTSVFDLLHESLRRSLTWKLLPVAHSHSCIIQCCFKCEPN